MKSSILLALAFATMAAPALAQEANAPAGVMRDTDAALTCFQISDEAAQLSQTMGHEPHGSVFGRLGGVARAGAAMLIPGVGLATAAGDALTAPDRQRREAEAKAVENRWYYLNGLYMGQGCQEAASTNGTTPVTPAPAVQTAPLMPGS
jgi:hypothetical protein